VTNPSDPVITVTKRDGHQNMWSKIISRTNEITREILTETNLAFIELATGSAFEDNGAWRDASDQILLTRTGAEATNSQHKVRFLGNINSAGAVRLTLPEGDKHLDTTILGLSYFDPATSNSVLFAVLKNSNGQRLPSGIRFSTPTRFTTMNQTTFTPTCSISTQSRPSSN
jgi:hypothetical protein